MKLRSRLIGAAAVLLLLPTLALAVTESPASAAGEPVVLNDGGQNSAATQFLESQSLGNGGGTNTIVATFLVQHPVGRKITNVRFDSDNNGTDDTTNAARNVAVTSQFYSATGGANSLQTDRVTLSTTMPTPGGFGCTLFGNTTSRFDSTVRFRVVDDLNVASTTTLNQTVHWVRGDSNCTLSQDYPYLKGGMTQTATDVAPGSNVSFTFQCDDLDIDLFSTDDACDRAVVRTRNLATGAITNLADVTGIGDNTNKTFSVNFPTRGYYVVEGQFDNENGGGLPDTGGNAQGFWRFGSVNVNSAATSLSGSLAFTGAQPSIPPSVNPSTPTTAQATVGDADGGVQVIEWDADGNGTFERLDSTTPTKAGNVISTPSVSGGQLQQSVVTTTPGLKTVNARITDSGAMDASDNARKQLTFTGTLRVNAIPTASNVSTSTAEDTPVTVNLSGSDSDNQPDGLTYTIVTPPSAAQGTLDPVSGSTVVFHPTPNYNGPASFTYRVADGTAATVGAHASSNTATASITVNPVNDIPVIDANSATTNEDNPVNVTMVGHDVEDGTALHYTVSSQPTSGSAACTDPGVCTYSPNLDFNGTDSYIVKGTDNEGGSSTATVTITVVAVNDAPVATDDTVTVPEDSVNFPITLSASDVDDLVLTYTGPDDDVDHGTLSCAGQACAYTPAANYNGPDSFTFTVTDGGALTDSGTITIDVSAVNDAPVAIDVPDAVTDEDVALTTPVSGTDIDTGDVVTVDHTTDGPHGTTQVVGPNAVKYTPALNFNGIDAYGFTVTDSNGGFDDGTVTVTVNPVNDAPVVPDQPFTIAEDNPTILSIFAGDVDGDLLDWSILGPPAHGHVVGIGPDLVYVPNTNFVGDDTFQVQVSDGHLSDSATITVHVAPVNDQPTANGSTVTTTEDSAVTFPLSGSDVDGGSVSFTAPQAGPSHGGAVCAAGSCTYTPVGDFNGADQFQFTVSDGFLTDTASVTIIVTPVNDPPVVNPALVGTPEDTPVAVTIVAADIDGDALTYAVDAPVNGTMSGIAPNLVYTPNPNWFGTESLNVVANDGHGGSTPSLVGITVTSVNDAPLATGGSIATDEETPVSFQLGGFDVDGNSLTYTVDTAPPAANGSLGCDSAGACTFSPATNVNGEQVVAYTVSDGSLTSSSVFSVLVAPVNDPPVAANGSTLTSEDTAANIALGATDTEGDALTYSVTSPPSHGGLVCAGASCVYTPAANYNGADAFTWEANDGGASSNIATRTINVTAVNDAPQALDVARTTDEDIAVPIALLATDVDGDPITFSVDGPPSHGGVTIAGAVATYTPAANYFGTDSFTYRATDPSGAFTVGRVSLIVDEVPLLPTTITTGDPAIVKVVVNMLNPLLGVSLFPNLTGTLKSGSTPLAGRTLRFTVGTTVLCTGVTNAQGTATCTGGVMTGLNALLGLGYQVSFAGDFDYLASTGKGALVQVLTLKL
jgi:hypothetical protein